LDKRTARIARRLWVKPIPQRRRLVTFCLGNRETDTCIIDGNGESLIAPEEILCRYESIPIAVPEVLASDVEAIAIFETQKERDSQPHAWNGRMAHLVAFTPSRTANREDGRLLLRMKEAQYFHFMASNAVIAKEFDVNRFASPMRKKLIGNFDKWRTEVPPNVVNGLPINLFILTDDDKLVFSMRSAAVAIGPNDLSFAVHENLHPEHDRIGDGGRLDIAVATRRALREELGWVDDSESEGVADVNLLGFAIHTGKACYGIFGYARLPVTFAQLQLRFAMIARDRQETFTLIPVSFSARTICGFIHHHDLYDFVGTAAAFVMVHEGIKLATIDQEFARLQSN
jgi:hypothetical protein